MLDTSAFLGGIDPNILIGIELFTVPDVIKEIKTRHVREKVDLAIKLGRLKLLEPREDDIKIISRACEETGDLKSLSTVDKLVLALTLRLKNEGENPVLLTDDYSMQNVATALKIEYKAIQEKGIKKFLKWTIYCPGCNKKFPPDTKLTTCDECNTELKRFSSE